MIGSLAFLPPRNILKANIIFNITSKELKISSCTVFDKRFNSFESRGPLSSRLPFASVSKRVLAKPFNSYEYEPSLSVYFHADKTDFHLKGFAQSLVRCLSWCLLYTAQNRMLIMQIMKLIMMSAEMAPERTIHYNRSTEYFVLICYILQAAKKIL